MLERVCAGLPNDRAALRVAIGTASEREALLEQARTEGLVGPLHLAVRSLDASGSSVDPASAARTEAWARRLTSLRAAQHLRNERLEQNLVEIASVLRASDTDLIPLKGTELGRRLYGDVGTRRSSDIDILVRPRDVPTAIDALGRLGYQAELRGLAHRWYARYYHHVHLVRANAPIVDLHFRLHIGFGSMLAHDTFFARARPTQLAAGEETALRLDPVDEFLFLSVHLVGHRFQQLGWLYDLKMFVRRHPDLDWERLLARARALGVVEALGAAVALLSDRLDVRVPVRLPNPSAASRLAVSLSEAYGTRVGPMKLRSLAYSVMMADTPSMALHCLRHRLLHVVSRELLL